jgi:hypothetical protein
VQLATEEAHRPPRGTRPPGTEINGSNKNIHLNDGYSSTYKT